MTDRQHLINNARAAVIEELLRRRAEGRPSPFAVMAENVLFWRREAARPGNGPGRTWWARNMAKHCLRGAAPYLADADAVADPPPE